MTSFHRPSRRRRAASTSWAADVGVYFLGYFFVCNILFRTYLLNSQYRAKILVMPADYPFSVDRNEFKGKRILVTGGTKGMGEAIVRRLAMGGGSVATTARSPLPRGQTPALFVQ